MHLDEYTIARYLDARIAGPEKQQVETHLAGCPVCSEALASAYQMVQTVAEAEAPLPDPAAVQRAERLVRAPARVSRLDLFYGRPVGLALAALAVVGLGLAVYFGVLAPDQDRFRTTAAPRTLTATTPPDGALVEAQPLVFSWEPLEDAVRYRLMLYTDDASILWEGDTAEGLLTLPDTVRLETGMQYLWRVDALLANGFTTATELHAFTVAP